MPPFNSYVYFSTETEAIISIHKKNLQKIAATKVIYNLFNSLILLNQSIICKKTISCESITKFLFLLLIKLKYHNYIYNFFLINIRNFYQKINFMKSQI
jgi:predicted ABC-type ATPase